MFVKDKDGDFVNILLATDIANRGNHVECVFESGKYGVLYEGENCQAYMTELEKELAAFGKLLKVEIDNKPDEKIRLSSLARSDECTCGLGKEWEHPADHKIGCPFYAPF